MFTIGISLLIIALFVCVVAMVWSLILLNSEIIADVDVDKIDKYIMGSVSVLVVVGVIVCLVAIIIKKFL